VFGVAPDAMNHRRRHRVEKEQADEVQPGLARDDPTAGDVTDIPTRQPRAVTVGDIKSDIGSRVTGAHHEDTAVTQLRRVAVFVGVQLDDVEV